MPVSNMNLIISNGKFLIFPKPSIFMNSKFVLILILVASVLVCCSGQEDVMNAETANEKFCGWSTFGNCSTDSECIRGGCNGEVCQSEFEEKVLTRCDDRDCYNPNFYSLSCLCVGKECQWVKYLDISPEEAHSLIQTNLNNPDFVIIDVRTPEEYLSGHIKNAINIDYNSEEFFERIEGLNKSKTYFVYCRSGHRSAEAVKVMKELGFIEVYNLKTGINGWKAIGLPVVKETPEPFLFSVQNPSLLLTSTFF